MLPRRFPATREASHRCSGTPTATDWGPTAVAVGDGVGQKAVGGAAYSELRGTTDAVVVASKSTMPTRPCPPRV